MSEIETCNGCGFNPCVKVEGDRHYCLSCGAGFSNDNGAFEDAKKLLEMTVETLQGIDKLIGIGRATALVWAFFHRDRHSITDPEKQMLRRWIRLPTDAPESSFDILVYIWGATVPEIQDSPAFQVLIGEVQS